MTPQEFCYWLQGYFELGGENLSPEQVKVVREHLQLVFNKVTVAYVHPGSITKEAWHKAMADIRKEQQQRDIQVTCHLDDKISDGMHQLIKEFNSNLKSDPPVYPSDLLQYMTHPVSC